MNYRQQHLIDYLRKQNGYKKQKDILADLAGWYDYAGNETNMQNCGARRLLTADIKAIREEGNVCLFSNTRGVRLGSLDEAILYHAKRLRTFAEYINKEKTILKGYGLKGQQAIDGVEKEFVEGNV